MTTPSALISVRVPSAIAERLEKLAGTLERSKSYLAAKAIEDHLDTHEWQVQAIQEGLDQIEQGAVVDFEEINTQWNKDED